MIQEKKSRTKEEEKKVLEVVDFSKLLSQYRETTRTEGRETKTVIVREPASGKVIREVVTVREPAITVEKVVEKVVEVEAKKNLTETRTVVVEKVERVAASRGLWALGGDFEVSGNRSWPHRFGVEADYRIYSNLSMYTRADYRDRLSVALGIRWEFQ